MKRKPKGPTLVEYMRRYFAERDVCQMYQQQLLASVKRLCEFAGRVLLVSQLTCDLVNSWVASMMKSELAGHSVNSYRGNILALWNAAYMDRLNDEAPLRVRKVKKPRLRIECYTHAHIQQLLAAAAKLRGYDLNGNRRPDFWRALIHAAYSSGLRRGDVLSIPKAAVADDGLYTCNQHKTGFPITVRLSSEALQYAANLQSPRGLLIEWPYRLDSFTVGFQRVRNHAGIDVGSFRWLRRSAGSYAEAEVPGAGAKLLGHRDPGVFKRHYEDAKIAAGKPIEPPAITAPKIAS